MVAALELGAGVRPDSQHIGDPLDPSSTVESHVPGTLPGFGAKASKETGLRAVFWGHKAYSRFLVQCYSAPGVPQAPGSADRGDARVVPARDRGRGYRMKDTPPRR